MTDTKPNIVVDLIVKCLKCDEYKEINKFIFGKRTCKDCNNNLRRLKYKNDEEHRIKLIKTASDFKSQKRVEIQKIKKDEIKLLEEEIGQENTICKYCENIQPKTRFRHNRLKCIDCEREEPLEKFKRYIRTRIYNSLKRNKSKHSVQYLGCNMQDYQKWICSYTPNYTIDNYGSIWHIDHVIPLSKFNLENEDEQLLAFNWKNTMPLSAKENLSKNNRILSSQIEQHYKKLLEFHIENEITFPQIFVNLYAKYLAAGNPLEP
jgi:hypothetical protein